MPSKPPTGIANFVSMWLYIYIYIYFSPQQFQNSGVLCYRIIFQDRCGGSCPPFLNKNRSLSSSHSLSCKLGIREDLQLKSWDEKCFSWGLSPFLWLWIVRINAVVWIPLGLHVFRTFPVRMWWITWYMICIFVNM